MRPLRNPTAEDLAGLISASEHKAAKWLKDLESGDTYYWPAEAAQHAEMAQALKVERYEKGLAVMDDRLA